jgi:hypothetical protein
MAEQIGTVFTPGMTSQKMPSDVQPISMMGAQGKALAAKTAPVSAFTVKR